MKQQQPIGCCQRYLNTSWPTDQGRKLPADMGMVKGQHLGAGDRAALEALITLAGALAVGTVFALFFSTRRKAAAIAVFEAVVVVGVLSAMATTASFGITLLHRDQAIGIDDLTVVATPLIVAVFVLATVSVVARVPRPFGRGLPSLCIAVFAAAAIPFIALRVLSVDPSNATPTISIVLVAGLLAGVVAWAAERISLRIERRWEQRRIGRLLVRGYVPGERTIGLALPRCNGDNQPKVGCWLRDGKTYLEFETFRQLRAEADERWEAVGRGKASLLEDRPVLFRVRIDPWIPWITPLPSVQLVVSAPKGDTTEIRLPRTADGLFEVDSDTVGRPTSVTLASGAPQLLST